MEYVEPLPYYKWLWRDWRASRAVRKMHYIARGFYRELLDESWAKGGIPDDIVELADICDCPVNVMKTYWPEIEQHFIPHPHRDGVLINLKQESIRTEQDRDRVNGKAGGTAKASRRKTATQTSLDGLYPPLEAAEQSRAEQSHRQSKAEAKSAPPIEAVPDPPKTETKPPVPTLHELRPLYNPEIATKVRLIVCDQPRAALKNIRPNECTHAAMTAVLDAAEHEMQATGCNLMGALEFIHERVKHHARDVPLTEHRFLKEPEAYFREKDYRIDAKLLSRQGAKHGGQSRTDENLEAVARAREDRARARAAAAHTR